jgi:hypothetical protein
MPAAPSLSLCVTRHLVLYDRSGGLAAYVVSDESIAVKTAFLKKAATARGGAVRPRLVAHGSLVRPAPQVLPQRMFAGEPLQVSAGPLGCSRGKAGPDWE